MTNIKSTWSSLFLLIHRTLMGLFSEKHRDIFASFPLEAQQGIALAFAEQSNGSFHFWTEEKNLDCLFQIVDGWINPTGSHDCYDGREDSTNFKKSTSEMRWFVSKFQNEVSVLMRDDYDNACECHYEDLTQDPQYDGPHGPGGASIDLVRQQQWEDASNNGQW